MQVTELKKAFVSKLSDEIDAAIAPILAKYGLSQELVGGTFSANEWTKKIKVVVPGMTSPMEARQLELVGLKIGQAFEYKGDRYTVTGYNSRAPRFPVEAKKNGDTKSTTRFPVATVHNLLGTGVTAASLLGNEVLSHIGHCRRGGQEGICFTEGQLKKFSDYIGEKEYVDLYIPLPGITMAEQKKRIDAEKSGIAPAFKMQNAQYWESNTGSHGWCNRYSGKVEQWG